MEHQPRGLVPGVRLQIGHRSIRPPGIAPERTAASEAPKYVASLEGRHLYLHARRLHPAQHWPCPLLIQGPCRSCSLLEHDGSGAPQCVALWKMKAIVHGVDAGESFEDVRDWIRNS